MTDDKHYVVVGFGAYVDTVDSFAILVQRGGPVPSNAKPEAIEHLLNAGLIAEAPAEGGIDAVLPGDGTLPAASEPAKQTPAVKQAAKS